MAPKRRPGKERNPQISDESVAIYKEWKMLREIQNDCAEGRGCYSADPNQHCTSCLRAQELQRRLGELLAYNWCTMLDPLRCDTPQPPDYIAKHPAKAEMWSAMYLLRQELEMELM